MAKKKSPKIVDEAPDQTPAVERANHVPIFSVSDELESIPITVAGDTLIVDGIEIPAIPQEVLQPLEAKEESKEMQAEDLKKFIAEAVNEAIEALPKTKPLMQELNEIAAQLNHGVKNANEGRSIYTRQQGELETVMLLFSNLKHKLGFLSPDMLALPVIKRIQAEIFGINS